MSETKKNGKPKVFGALLGRKPTLDEVKQHFKGKGGDGEAESHVIDANADKKEGFVWFYSNKADAAKVIDRCEKDIIDYHFLDSGIQLKIARKAFRGMQYAFRRTK